MNKCKMPKACKMKTSAQAVDDLKTESCRICLTPNYKMSNIFNRKLIEQIRYCTGIKITKQDGLPTKICKNCQTSLTVAHKFKKLCILTEQVCQKVLESRIKSELIHDSSTILENESDDDHFKDGWLKQDQSNNNFNEDFVKKDHLNYTFNGNCVKKDLSNDNFNRDCIKEDCNDNFNDLSDDDHFNGKFDGDQANNDIDNMTNDEGNGITIVKKEETKCEYEDFTEDISKEILNSLKGKSPIDRPRRQLKPRKLEEVITKIKQTRKKRGPYRKKNEPPKRRKKFKYFKLFCETCQIKFTCKKDSDAHKETFHKEAWSTMCETCQIKFTCKKDSDAHKETFHKETWSTMCEICGKLFAHRGSFTLHIRGHYPPANFCEHCDYSTTNKYDLIKHLLIHSGTKKYQCSKCPRTYYTVSNLRDHERMMHERLLRYPCDICGKMFYDRTHLRRHVDSHNDVKRFECQTCRTAFTRRCYWKKHLLKEHGIMVPRLRPGRAAAGGAGHTVEPTPAASS